ncbi:MAG: alpha/beta hydrolase [Alicyclobacillus macrosporangiidus]|uniref:alpha/beta fold hydrolase n=1 Tax=Alicyclobacillus macrosporangiidus TaxID=392015 RepID=UPI0026F0F247|nr:alpha/beta hydrolase [Alicyclobacillus macrosporangiidus]MCL6600518.1 alpha/beta hydrolase [Alicyclobacillus macrosporangiidus]
MQEEQLTLVSDDGQTVFARAWMPDTRARQRGVVHLVHGMGEHSARYAHVAAALVQEGYALFAADLRGHGHTLTRGLGDFGPSGFAGLVQDVVQLDKEIRSRCPGLPVFLLGHSMGTVVAAHALPQLGPKLAGLILSGTIPKRKDVRIGRWIAHHIAKRYGDDHVSPWLTKLVFGAYNRPFRPGRTPFDWLTRDVAMVDMFVGDERCGAPLTAGAFQSFFQALEQQLSPALIRHIPSALPVFLISGERDPVGGFGKSIRDWVRALERQGVRDIKWRLYPEGRHEMLNELNRDEVLQDLLAWLKAHTHD